MPRCWPPPARRSSAGGRWRSPRRWARARDSEPGRILSLPLAGGEGALGALAVALQAGPAETDEALLRDLERAAATLAGALQGARRAAPAGRRQRAAAPAGAAAPAPAPGAGGQRAGERTGQHPGLRAGEPGAERAQRTRLSSPCPTARSSAAARA
ncbi:MAG: hypothetical protein MZV65_39925 [Chromatiales bacterium]|nr:hypothetical protein [Chromatiales bacterium]